MPRKNDFDYFDCFVSMVDHCCSAASLLADCLEHYNPDVLSQKIVEMHSIEHAADLIKHDLLEHLAREFISPIEREDILTLSQHIDDVTDAIEDVLLRMYMFRIHTLRPQTLEFSQLIVKCCASMKKMMEEFKHFRKSNSIKDHVVEINRLEEVGDHLYTEAMHSLFEPGNDPLQVMAWVEAFDHLEICCDACEDVADVVESVIMKNS